MDSDSNISTVSVSAAAAAAPRPSRFVRAVNRPVRVSGWTPALARPWPLARLCFYCSSCCAAAFPNRRHRYVFFGLSCPASFFLPPEPSPLPRAAAWNYIRVADQQSVRPNKRIKSPRPTGFQLRVAVSEIDKK